MEHMTKKQAKKTASKKAATAEVQTKKRVITLMHTIGYILAACGLLGLLAASVLMLEKMAVLQDPNYQPSCNLNPVISCGSVMQTKQADAFGLSNSIVGIAGFSVVATIGFAIIAGAQFKRWFWRGMLAGSTFGVTFSMWLFLQGVYNIGAVCPYCALIWVVTIVQFIYVLYYCVEVGHIPVPAKIRRPVNFLKRHHGDVLFVWLLAIALIILTHFWYYWKTLL